MQSQQDYQRPRPPQPPHPPSSYPSLSSHPSYSSVRPLPTPTALPPPPQNYSTRAQNGSAASPPSGSSSGFRYPLMSPGGSEYSDGRGGSGWDSLRSGSGVGSPQSGVYDSVGRAGGYRREPSSGSAILSPTGAPRGHSPLPPIPPRQPSYPVSPPPPSAPPPRSPDPPYAGRSSTHSASSFSPHLPHSSPRTSPSLPQGTICTATADLESLAVVPLSNLASVEAVKDVIMSKLHIADEDMPRHAFYLTSIGRGEGRPVSDDELWEALSRSATGEGPQITVFVKEVVAASQFGMTGADFAVGMSAEKMRQVQQAREREQRERERERGREHSGSSMSMSASLSATQRSPTAGSTTAQRRERGASVSEHSDISSGRRASRTQMSPPTAAAATFEVDEFGGRVASPPSERGSGLRSDRPGWTAAGGGGAQSWSHASRGLSASEGASSALEHHPHPRTASGGQLSPSRDRFGGSGFRDRAGSFQQTTSPEDYFQSSPPLSTSALHSPPMAAGPSSGSAYHPHLPTSPTVYPGSSQIVMGPSGPTRFLPPQPLPPPPPQDQQQQHFDPRQRMNTAPTIQVTSPGWSHTITAPQHGASIPPARPVHSPYAGAPPPPRPLPPTDPRNALPQYSSQPYKNLPLPNSSSPYHNLALQGNYGSVVHPSPQPPSRSGNLSPHQGQQGQQHQRRGSKSADDLRSIYSNPPQPPIPPPLPQGYRGPLPPSGGSRTPQPPVPPPHPSGANPPSASSSYITSPPPAPPTPASAFYSAPVQAQHQAAARAAGGASSSSTYLPSSGTAQPPAHSQSQPYVPQLPPGAGTPGGLRRPTLEQQSKSQPVTAAVINGGGGGGGAQGMRPSTMYDLASGALDLRPGETVQQGRTRRASENAAESLSGEGDEGRLSGSALRRVSNSSAGSGAGRSPVPSSLQPGGAGPFSPTASSISSAHPSPLIARDSPATAFTSPTPSAPPFQDDDGAYDGIAEPDRGPLPPSLSSSAKSATTGSTSPPSSVRSSQVGPLTPSSTSGPSAPPPPPSVAPRVDEFGDPLDEDTSTWLVGSSLPVSFEKSDAGLDEYGDPIGEDTSTWFNPPGAPSPFKPDQQPQQPKLPRVDEFGDPIDEQAGTWFTPPAPTPLQPTDGKPVSSATTDAVTTTAVPAPSSYGASSPMARQHSAPGSSSGSGIVGGGGSGGGGGGSGSGSAGPSSAVSHHERRDSVPVAQDWKSEILTRFGAAEEGTILPGRATGTIRPQQQASPAPPTIEAAKPKLVDEFGDDLDDEGATWIAGHGPAGAGMPSSHAPPASPHSPSFDRHKRPNLRLTINAPTPPPASAGLTPSSSQRGDPSPAPQSGARRSASSGEQDPSVGPLPSLGTRRSEAAGRRGLAGTPRLDDLVRIGTSGPSPSFGPMPMGSQFARRNSLAARAQDDKDWAFRPPVETVLENLDVFFPEHDLDKPVFDLPTPGPSTPSTNSSSSPIRDVAAPSTLMTRRTGHSTASGLGYKKSIRVVALDRKRQLQKAGRNVASAASGLANNLLRRRSTKLFGARIEEVTSAQMKQINAIKETSVEDPENFSYKWIKGDLIGRGTYGHVYIALSVTTGETIAVKQVEMPRTYSDKEDQRTKGMISSLKAEIELLKDLDHPNIVLYLGMEQTPEFLSIFLEYVPGGSIGRIIRTHGKFEENVIKFFTHQILDGLAYLHALGILHRDMKADNILIDQDGMCKISDFGTSKKSGDIYQNNENMSMQGSIFWMAPEVIHNNKQGYSAKADIWSLGCICIEMLAGSRPWEGEGFMGAMFKLGAERMRPPVPPDVQLSENAEKFVSDCLQIEPEDRPKASEAKHHPFLVIDPGWSFAQTSLYRIMTAEEDRRRISHPSTPSAQAAS
ncbi:hypothetical protein JCM6882_007339 [Rhodosporidiobolus microsporus]